MKTEIMFILGRLLGGVLLAVAAGLTVAIGAAGMLAVLIYVPSL